MHRRGDNAPAAAAAAAMHLGDKNVMGRINENMPEKWNERVHQYVRVDSSILGANLAFPFRLHFPPVSCT